MAPLRMSLRTLALFLFSIAVAAILCLLAYFGMTSWNNRVAATLQRLEYQALLIAAENNQAISDTREFIRAKLGHADVERLIKDGRCSALVAEWSAARPRLVGLGVVLPNGDLVCSSRPNVGHYNISDRTYFQQALKASELVIGEAVVSRAKGTWNLPFAQTIRDDRGRPVAVVVALLDLSKLSRGLSGEVETSGIQVGLFDASGRILAHYPHPERWVGKSLPPYPQWNQEIASGEPFSGESFDLQGVFQLFALVPFAQTSQGPVKLWLGMEKQRVMGDIERDFAVSAAIAVFILLAGTGLVWFAGDRLVLRRIEAISRAAKRLGEGDLGARIGDRRHGDEIGELAQSFDDMAESLAAIDALTRTNRALRVLAAGTAVIPHAADEKQLVDSVCKEVAQAGGYRLVWVGYADDGPDGRIKRVACAGPAAAELGSHPEAWTDDSGGAIPAAMRDGKAVIVGPSSPCPCGVEGEASMLVLPLIASGKPIGILCFCDRADSFREEGMLLPQGLATELAAAIAAHRARTEQGHLQSSLEMSERRFRAAAEAMLDALMILDVVRDTQGQVVDLLHVEANEAACRMMSTTREELIGKLCIKGNRTGNPAFVAKCVQVIESGQPLEEEFEVKQPMIAAHWVRHQIVPLADGVLVIARDITAAKEAEKALRNSEQRLQLALEGAEQGVFDWDLVEDKAYYSPRLQAMVGYQRADFTNASDRTSWGGLIHPDDLPAVGDAVDAHLRGETELLRTECRMRNLTSGSYLWMLTRAKITERNARGEPIRITGVITDITKAKDAALELEASRELYRSLADALPLGLCRLDRQGRVLFVNPAMANIIGADTPERAVGQEVYQVSLDGDLDSARRLDRQVMETGEILTRIEEYTLRGTDEKRHFEVIRVPVRDAEGEIIGLQAVIRDVTALVKAHEQQRLAALVFESSHQGIAVMDVERNILTVNKAYARITGYTEEEARGHKAEFIKSGIHAHDMPEQIQSAMLRTGHWEGRIWSRRKSGEIFPQFITFDALRNAAGEITNFLAMHMDISDLVRSEEKIRKLNEDLELRVEERTHALEAVVKELESFSYSVSHDLRAPLRGIEGFTRLLEQKHGNQLDEAGKGYLQRVRRNVSRMEQLIDDMLTLSNVTRSPLRTSDVDVSRTAREILAELGAAAPERKMLAQVEDDIRLHGDARLLRIALENLIGNAWKFTAKRDAAQIVIGTEDTAHGKAVFVRDNGAGFDMRYLDKLFVSFQRLHSPTEFEGTGIGLATVQRVVNRHGGRIWAEGALGVGATFYFVI